MTKTKFNQEILAREDLLKLGYNLLKYRQYPHHIAQEISLDALYMCAKKYSDDRGATVKTYYNKCLFWVSGHHAAKRRKRLERIGMDSGLEEINPGEYGEEPTVALTIEAEQILSLLVERQRDILGLVYLEKFTMSEVAEMYGVTRQRIGQIVQEAREILRKKLRKDPTYQNIT